jgi:tetratricopeptide (TPR) repeat protein
VHEATVEKILKRVAPGAYVDQAVFDQLLLAPPHPEQIVGLLADADPERVRAAVLFLGLYGTHHESPVLALCLHHADDGVVRLAEHSLWALWMQAGTPDGNRQLAAAISQIAAANFWDALRLLNKLVDAEPGFAEAHFQRGLVMVSLERTAESIAAHEHALRLNSYHFAAAAAIGHALVQQGDLPRALEYYRRALRIHPRLPDVPEAIATVEAVLARRRSEKR